VDEDTTGAGRTAAGFAEGAAGTAAGDFRKTNQKKHPTQITSTPASAGRYPRRFGGPEGAGAAAAFAAGTKVPVTRPGGKPGKERDGAAGRRAGNSGTLNSGGLDSIGLSSGRSGRLGNSGDSPDGADFNLILIPDSDFSSPGSRTGGVDPEGNPGSAGLAKGVRSISTFSPVIPAVPIAPELSGDPTGGNPESEMASPAGAGSDGLIEIRGRSLTGGEPTWGAPAAGVSLEGTDGMGAIGAADRKVGRSSGTAGTAGESGSVDGGELAAEPLSVRSLSFSRDSGGGEGSSLIRMTA